jgi:hypothetical protein
MVAGRIVTGAGEAFTFFTYAADGVNRTVPLAGAPSGYRLESTPSA